MTQLSTLCLWGLLLSSIHGTSSLFVCFTRRLYLPENHFISLLREAERKLSRKVPAPQIDCRNLIWLRRCRYSKSRNFHFFPRGLAFVASGHQWQKEFRGELIIQTWRTGVNGPASLNVCLNLFNSTSEKWNEMKSLEGQSRFWIESLERRVLSRRVTRLYGCSDEKVLSILFSSLRWLFGQMIQEEREALTHSELRNHWRRLSNETVRWRGGNLISWLREVNGDHLRYEHENPFGSLCFNSNCPRSSLSRHLEFMSLRKRLQPSRRFRERETFCCAQAQPKMCH